MKYFKGWIRAQGGDESIVENLSLLPHAKHKMEIYTPQSGYISHIDTQKIGQASLLLGAGRNKKEDKIQMGAGILLAAKRGENISKGALLATLYTDDTSFFAPAKEELLSAYVFSDTPPKDVPLVYDVIR